MSPDRRIHSEQQSDVSDRSKQESCGEKIFREQPKTSTYRQESYTSEANDAAATLLSLKSFTQNNLKKGVSLSSIMEPASASKEESRHVLELSQSKSRKRESVSSTSSSDLSEMKESGMDSAASISEETLDDKDKPNQSYISLIANAILASSDKRLVLSDIYNYVLDKHPYFRDKGPGWRNSIRHNLSLNECFVKAGRSPNGKGHFWAINPANFEDFSKGDFRRRRAQRRARRAMLSDTQLSTDLMYAAAYQNRAMGADRPFPYMLHPFMPPPPLINSRMRTPDPTPISVTDLSNRLESMRSLGMEQNSHVCKPPSNTTKKQTPKRKRGFDVESLLKDDKSDDELKPSRSLRMSWTTSKPLRVDASDNKDWNNRKVAACQNKQTKSIANSCDRSSINSCQCHRGQMPSVAQMRVPPYHLLPQPSPSMGFAHERWMADSKYR